LEGLKIFDVIILTIAAVVIIYIRLRRYFKNKPLKIQLGVTKRDLVFYIFTLDFLIGILIQLYVLFNIPELLEILPSKLNYVVWILYLYLCLLNCCFLAVVYWVSKDEKQIEELRKKISMSESLTLKNEQTNHEKSD